MEGIMLDIKFFNLGKDGSDLVDDFCGKFMERGGMDRDIYITTSEIDLSFPGELIVINGLGKNDYLSDITCQVFQATGIHTYSINSQHREMKSRKNSPILNVSVAVEKVKEVISKLKKMNVRIDTAVHFLGAGYHKFSRDVHIQLSVTNDDIELLGCARGILLSRGISAEQITIDVLANFIPKAQMKFP